MTVAEDGRPLALQGEAEAFAKRLSDLTSAFRGHPHPFTATSVGDKWSVTSAEPIPVVAGCQTLLSVTVLYRCLLDHASRYLAVTESAIKVHAGRGAKGDPLFRFEYIRDQAPDLPAAHLHVHAHRDQMILAMTLAGQHGAERRAGLDSDDSLKGARLSELHFPLGGHRFRPGLEDVLQMLRSEFGAEAGPDWETALRDTREKYRRDQTAAAVRDCPSEATRVLRELGYEVQEPEGRPVGDRDERLNAF